MNLIIQKKSIPEFLELEKSVIDADKNLDQMFETWKILDNFFRQDFYEKDFIWRWTYFHLYVRLTWKIIDALSDEDLVRLTGRQVFMAIIQDIDVLDRLLWIWALNKANKNNLVSFYLKIKTAFLESEEVVGRLQENDVFLKNLVSEYILLQKRGGDSMEEAVFISKLKQIFFPAEIEARIYVDQDVAVGRFLELINFFQEMDDKKIWFVVDMFSDPEKYNKTENDTDVVGEDQLSAPVEVAKDSAPQSIAPAEIKSQIESQFPKNTNGEFENIEAVLSRLEELAAQYNDPRIAEMMYFDEQAGMFKWNI